MRQYFPLYDASGRGTIIAENREGDLPLINLDLGSQ